MSGREGQHQVALAAHMKICLLREVFLWLQSRAPLDVFSFSSFMQLAVAEGAPPEQNEELLLEMEAQGIEPSSQIFLFMMQAYIRQGDISGAEGVLARILNRGACCLPLL